MYHGHVTICVTLFASFCSVFLSLLSSSSSSSAAAAAAAALGEGHRQRHSAFDGGQRNKRSLDDDKQEDFETGELGLRQSPDSAEAADADSGGAAPAKRPFCSGYRGCVGKRIAEKIRASMKNHQHRHHRSDKRQVMMAWPEDNEKRQSLWAWPDTAEEKEKDKRDNAGRGNDRNEQLSRLYEFFMSEPRRKTRQSLTMWPSQEKRFSGDQPKERRQSMTMWPSEEKKSAGGSGPVLDNRHKRPFCSPYRGCVSAESEAEKRETRSFVEEEKPEMAAYDYNLMPEEAMNFLLTG